MIDYLFLTHYEYFTKNSTSILSILLLTLVFNIIGLFSLHVIQLVKLIIIYTFSGEFVF